MPTPDIEASAVFAELLVRLGATEPDASARLATEFHLPAVKADATVATARLLLRHGAAVTRPTPWGALRDGA